MSETGHPIRALVIGTPAVATRALEALGEAASAGRAALWVSACSAVPDAIEALRGDGEECAVVFDESLDAAAGLEAVARLAAARPGVPVVLVAEVADVGPRALQVGAQEFLTPGELASGLRRAVLCAVERSRRRPAPRASDDVLAFGGYELDPRIPELREAGRPLRIHLTPLRLLLHLARNAGRTVPKDELLREVWCHAVVSDTAISSALKELRRALRDDGRQQRFIETRRGVGYRFTPPVVPVAKARPPRGRARPLLDGPGFPFPPDCLGAGLSNA